MVFLYSKLKDDYGYTLDKLSKRLGIAVSKLNRYISFSKVPQSLWDAVGNLSKVSSRTSSEILEMINADPDALDFFISVSDKIARGFGHTRLRKLYYDYKNSSKKQNIDANFIRVSKRDIKINLGALELSEKDKVDLVEKINILIDYYK